MKVLTANGLLDGAVVYRAWTGGWTRELALAQRFGEADAPAALAAAETRPDQVIGPYLVAVGPERPEGRDRNKERIRAAGPTVGHSLDAR